MVLPTRPRLECPRETGLILRCDRKVGNPFLTKQGSRPSRPDQEGRKGSEEGVPDNLRVPLEGDRDFGELCGLPPPKPRFIPCWPLDTVLGEATVVVETLFMTLPPQLAGKFQVNFA